MLFQIVYVAGISAVFDQLPAGDISCFDELSHILIGTVMRNIKMVQQNFLGRGGRKILPGESAEIGVNPLRLNGEFPCHDGFRHISVSRRGNIPGREDP